VPVSVAVGSGEVPAVWSGVAFSSSDVALTVATSPVIGNVTVTINSLPYVTNSAGTVTVSWPVNSTNVSIVIPSTVDTGPGARASFLRWSDGSTAATLSLLVNMNMTITANFKLQYLVTINSLYGDPQGSGWYDQGVSASISVRTPINDTLGTTKYAFNGWSGSFTGTDNPATIIVNTPMTLTALWTTQFYLSVDPAGHATVSGAGWYTAGTAASFVLSQPSPDNDNGVWYVFQGWSGDYEGASPSGSIMMSKPMVIKAVWIVRDFVHFTFSEGTNATKPVMPIRVQLIGITTPNGTKVMLEKPGITEGFWLDEGTYRVDRAIVFGVNCLYENQTQSFSTTPNGQVTIGLAIYSMYFNVRDMLLNSPVDGAQFNITMPDGTGMSAVSINGAAVLYQLPAASYPYKVSKNGVMDARGTATIVDKSKVVQVSLIVVTSLAMIIAIIVVAVVGGVFFLLKRGKGLLKISRHNHVMPKQTKTKTHLPPDLLAQLKGEESEMSIPETAAETLVPEAIAETAGSSDAAKTES